MHHKNQPINEALPGVLGNRGKRVFVSWEQGNKCQILRGTGEQRQYWGIRNIRKQIFDFLGTGEHANLFQGNKGTGTPLGGPHKSLNLITDYIDDQCRILINPYNRFIGDQNLLQTLTK